MRIALSRALLRLALLPALGIAVAAGAPAPQAAAQIVAKMGTATINDDQHEWLKRYKARLEKRFPNRIRIDIFPASQLGSAQRQIEGMQLGTVEGWLGPGGFLAGVEQRYQVFDSPGIFADMDHCFRTVSDPALRGPALKLAEPKGLVGVSVYCSSHVAYNTRKPVRTLADMKGMKMRVLASKIERRVVEEFGATPTPMDLSEVMGALQQGTIDGVKSAISIFYPFKFFSVAKYVTATHEAFIVDFVFLSKMWFDQLPADIQAGLREEAASLDPEIQAFDKDFQNGMYEAWKKEGGEVIQLAPEEKAEMMRRTANAGAEVVKDSAPQKAFYDLMVATAQKHKH